MSGAAIIAIICITIIFMALESMTKNSNFPYHSGTGGCGCVVIIIALIILVCLLGDHMQTR